MTYGFQTRTPAGDILVASSDSYLRVVAERANIGMSSVPNESRFDIPYSGTGTGGITIGSLTVVPEYRAHLQVSSGRVITTSCVHGIVQTEEPLGWGLLMVGASCVSRP